MKANNDMYPSERWECDRNPHKESELKVITTSITVKCIN